MEINSDENGAIVTRFRINWLIEKEIKNKNKRLGIFNEIEF